MALQATAQIQPLDLIVHIPSARVGVTRLLAAGYSVERVEIDRAGPRCAVTLFETGRRDVPDFKLMSDALSWLIEHGYTAYRAEWLGPVKNPRIWIMSPASNEELEPAMIGTRAEGRLTVCTWCAVRFGCEIRWEEMA